MDESKKGHIFWEREYVTPENERVKVEIGTVRRMLVDPYTKDGKLREQELGTSRLCHCVRIYSTSSVKKYRMSEYRTFWEHGNYSPSKAGQLEEIVRILTEDRNLSAEELALEIQGIMDETADPYSGLLQLTNGLSELTSDSHFYLGHNSILEEISELKRDYLE
jgi:hypothetical protein